MSINDSDDAGSTTVEKCGSWTRSLWGSAALEGRYDRVFVNIHECIGATLVSGTSVWRTGIGALQTSIAPWKQHMVP